MFTYEVNLLCDWNASSRPDRCPEIATGEPCETPLEGVASAVDEAHRMGWKRIGGCWYCADHAELKES